MTLKKIMGWSNNMVQKARNHNIEFRNQNISPFGHPKSVAVMHIKLDVDGNVQDSFKYFHHKKRILIFTWFAVLGRSYYL